MKGAALDTAVELTGMVGEENVSTDELDLLCYSKDLAPMPDELLTSYGMIPPEAVVRPGNAPSLAVCRRLGMESLGRTSRYYDSELELYRMRRDLTAGAAAAG